MIDKNDKEARYLYLMTKYKATVDLKNVTLTGRVTPQGLGVAPGRGRERVLILSNGC